MTLRSHLQYVYSCDLDVPIRVKVGALEGYLAASTLNSTVGACAATSTSTLRDAANVRSIFAQLRVYSDGRAIGQSVRTTYRPMPPPHNTGAGEQFVASKHRWNEWLTLPIRYRCVYFGQISASSKTKGLQ